ncbi:MAG: serine/threonine protein kinase/tetratricopeptide (TPR) repeat protein [Candidatus Azotimanducaceae bacterium]|jgi:serine/threonine protein kinase/tetratricopeptide (TPR) repeat protein
MVTKMKTVSPLSKLNPNTKLGDGRFIILEAIGSGGMGDVYRAFDSAMGCEVALKTLRIVDADSLFQIKKEFRILKPLIHGNLVRLHELCCVPGQTNFFTMELLRGQSMDDYILRSDGRSESNQLDSAGWQRLAQCTLQIAHALKSIHNRDLVHQDVKPENVTVLRGGRAVLVDFGFATSTEDIDDEITGSPAFMAPEQMDGDVSPSADWYALGTSLKAITRNTLQADWPSGYADLIKLLTKPIPETRGGYEAVVSWTSTTQQHQDILMNDSSELFVGRESQLETLRKSLSVVKTDRKLQVVKITGPSGIGKTEVINHFLSLSEKDGEKILIFKERCHLRESINLRLLDSLVDDLSRHLLQQPIEMVEALRPANLGALLNLFPVLGRVPGFQHEMHTFGDDASFVSLGIRALRDLLFQISKDNLLIISLDDFQWADAESLQAISEILKAPNNPEMLLLLTVREDALSTELAEGIDNIAGLEHFIRRLKDDGDILVDEVNVPPLDLKSSQKLLFHLAGDRAIDLTLAESFIKSCEGSPLLLSRLANRFLDEGFQGSIDTWLQDELHTLTDHERDLVKLVAISGHPVGTTTLSTLYPGAKAILEQLSENAWLRLRMLGNRECVDVFHDRMSHAITMSMSLEETRTLHYRIATLLRGDHAYSASHLVGHYLSSGHQEEAARFALEAGEDSMKAFALNQAAALFETAYQLRGENAEDRWILERSADALKRAGRFVEAGEAYAKVVKLLGDEDQQPLVLANVHARAADAYLRGGDVGHARELFIEAARCLGINVEHRFTSLRDLLQRLQYQLRTPRLKKQGHASGETKNRLQILDEMVRTVIVVDGGLASQLSLRRLKEALKVGDPDFAALAAMNEGALQCFMGSPSLDCGARLIRAGQSWHDKSDPFLNAMNERYECVLNLFLGHWREGADAGVRAERIVLEHLPNDQFELGLVRQYLFINLANLGEVSDLQVRLCPLIKDAEERRDIGRMIFYSTSQCALAHLAEGRSEDVIQSCESFTAMLPSDQFTTQHYFVFQAEMLATLYEQQYESAHIRLVASWDAIERINMLKTNYWGIELRSYRGLIQLSLAATGTLVENIDREIRTQVAALHKLPGGTGAAHMLDAHLYLLRGNKVKASSRLNKALAFWQGAKMKIHALSALRRLQELEPDLSQPSIEEIDDLMRSLGIVEPTKMVNCYLPAIAV